MNETIHAKNKETRDIITDLLKRVEINKSSLSTYNPKIDRWIYWLTLFKWPITLEKETPVDA